MATVYPLTRIPDWSVCLAKLVEDRLHQRFRWGQIDCGTLWGDAVLCITGFDPISDLRGLWTSEEDAKALCAAEGGYAALIARRVGPRIPPRYARRGDLAAMESPRGMIVGPVLGEFVAVQTATGLSFATLASCCDAWRVG